MNSIENLLLTMTLNVSKNRFSRVSINAYFGLHTVSSGKVVVIKLLNMKKTLKFKVK